MREITDRGILLHVQPYQESDALLTFLMEKEGKRKLIAKGIRSARSKRQGTIQIFSEMKLARSIPKNEQALARLLSTEFLFAPDVSDPILLAELSLLAEASLKLLAERQVISGVFSLWQKFLQISFAKPREEICGFILQLGTLLGIFPYFQNCTKCGKKFSKQSTVFWHPKQGLFCCKHLTDAAKLTFDEIKSLFFFQTVSSESFSRLILPEQDIQKLFNLLLGSIEVLAQKPFSSREVFEELFPKK